MNPNNIGLDSYLSRELNRYHDEQDEAVRLRRIEEIKKEISDLEDELHDLTYYKEDDEC